MHKNSVNQTDTVNIPR